MSADPRDFLAAVFHTVQQEVYLLRADRGERPDLGDKCLFKVGRTKNYGARLSALQTGCPYPLTYGGGTRIADSGVCPVSVEGRVHREMARYRTQGEWYECTWIQALKAWRDVANEFAPGSWDDEVPDQPWGEWLSEVANDRTA